MKPLALENLLTQLQAQSEEIATIHTLLDIQFKRIAQMQAELDLLPHARRRRQTMRALPAAPPAHNGDGSHD